VDEATEVTELLDVVRAIVRDDSSGCADVESSGAGVREAGPTDSLLILLFEVDTGIMEVEAPGSRDFSGVWNAYMVDLGLIGEGGLDFTCELVVDKVKPVDFRGFGVSGVDEDAGGNPSISFAFENKAQVNDICTYAHITLPLLLYLLSLPVASIRFVNPFCRSLLLLLQFTCLSGLCGG